MATRKPKPAPLPKAKIQSKSKSAASPNRNGKRKETKKATILSVPKRGKIKVKKPPRMGAGVPGFTYGRDTV
jgi:hypothetical protein